MESSFNGLKIYVQGENMFAPFKANLNFDTAFERVNLLLIVV